MLKNFFLVGLGGFLGSITRYAVLLLFKTTAFPIATLLVNIAGSLVIGMLVGLLKESDLSQGRYLFLATGICGGFTTFSALTAENLQLMQNGKLMLALVYIGSSIVFGIFAAWLGFKLTTN